MTHITNRGEARAEAGQLWRQKPCSSLQLCSCEPGRAIAKTKNRQTRQLPLSFIALDHTQTQYGLEASINVHTHSLALAQTQYGLKAGINAGARFIKMSRVFTTLRRHYLGRFLLLSFLLFSFFSGLQSQSLNQRLEAVLAGENVNADREFSALTRAKAEEFDETSKSLLLQIVASENIINQADYILLAGFLYGEELLPFVPETARKSAAVRRAINLAKVRGGNVERTENLLKNLETIPLNDDFVYTVVPMLIYTRQRAVLDYLLELVMISNSNCTPGDAETSGRIDCGYRLIEHLAVAIAEFPVAVDEDGDLLDNDYAAALIKVREWIALNKPYYTILTNTY